MLVQILVFLPLSPRERGPGGEVCVLPGLPLHGADVNGFGFCFKLIADG